VCWNAAGGKGSHHWQGIYEKAHLWGKKKRGWELGEGRATFRKKTDSVVGARKKEKDSAKRNIKKKIASKETMYSYYCSP